MKRMVLIILGMIWVGMFGQGFWWPLDEEGDFEDLGVCVIMGIEEVEIVDIIDSHGNWMVYYALPWKEGNGMGGIYYDWITDQEEEMSIFGFCWFMGKGTVAYNGNFYDNRIRTRLDRRHVSFDTYRPRRLEGVIFTLTPIEKMEEEWNDGLWEGE